MFEIESSIPAHSMQVLMLTNEIQQRFGFITAGDKISPAMMEANIDRVIVDML